MQPLDAGEPGTIGPYRLLGRLGAGGMGRVYLGRSAGGRTVAVKVVHPHFALDEEFRARFRREVEAARRVGGAWTAPVLDADPEASVPWVATGYVAGPSLAQAVAAYGPLPAHTVRALGAGLAEALGAVHALGLVHRDVKPSNVLLTLDGPRLIDFGIARASDGTASLTSSGVSIGSPGYMSPEQILGKGVTGAADVFSLGAVLAFAAMGASPFPGDSSAALLYKVVHEEPELDGLRDGDLRELRELITGCLAKEATARPAPAEVAGLLAPEGAAAAVAGGWLPGRLVESVSRTAVQLLNLEPQEASAPSGPIPFSSVSVGAEPVPSVPSAPVVGSFGPPDPSYADHRPAQMPEQQRRGSGPAKPADRVSLSLAATSTPVGGERRGRRLSCTVALAVAGALAVVMLGTGVLSGVLPGSGDPGTSDEAGGSQSSPPADGSSAPTYAGPTSGKVPAAYIGTWEGEVAASAAGVTLPGGTLRLVVEEGKAGEQFATAAQTDVLGASTCEDVMILKQVKEKELIAEGRTNSPGDSRCTQNAHTVRLRLSGDGIEYVNENPRSGNTEGLLSKVK
jgi:eukaryotic-like serine/threonine-protein kinase